MNTFQTLVLSTVFFIFGCSTIVSGQVLEAPLTNDERMERATVSERKLVTATMPENDPTADHENSPERGTDDEAMPSRQNGWYTPPDGKTRFKRYANNVVGPVALGRYAAVAGILTGRNAPKEWGGQWEGFGRRYASNLGESAIKNSVQYGLDVALDVDSHFYLSRDRSIAARSRNAVFSSVTSRNSKGRRVIGIPKIAGNIASNVISAETW